MQIDFTPVVIIGAGRSGTNMLRDALCRLDTFATWPCDEINPIWRHGNLAMAHDAFGAELASPPVRSFIRKRFASFWRSAGKPRFVVEKTCANSLRVSFVAGVLPEARFIYLVRDGRDVVRSAAKRWRGELEMPGLPYFLAKARYTPLSDLPFYGLRFLSSRIDMLRGKTERLSAWGPIFPGMHDLHPDTSLPELCARQWRACIDASDNAFGILSEDRWLEVRYEDFVAAPGAGLSRILDFLGAEHSPAACEAAVSGVSRTSVGKGHRTLATNDGAALLDILSPALERHGYEMEDDGD